MKLRNKKTGKIVELSIHHIAGKCYESLADINKEWEDYEEPKRTWYIDTWGSIRELEAMEIPIGWEEKPILEFGTKEEAEKAVEKLKAFKRLKDKGLRFSHHSFLDRRISYKVPVADEKIGKDLDLLFGGEE